MNQVIDKLKSLFIIHRIPVKSTLRCQYTDTTLRLFHEFRAFFTRFSCQLTQNALLFIIRQPLHEFNNLVYIHIRE